MCKERANVNMKLKLAQHRGQRENLMKSVCAAVNQLVECGLKLHHCLSTSEVKKVLSSLIFSLLLKSLLFLKVDLINASLLDNMETLLANLEHKTGFESTYCQIFNKRRTSSATRPDYIDKNQPVRLASPSINILDFSNNNRPGNRRNAATNLHLSNYTLYFLSIMTYLMVRR